MIELMQTALRRWEALREQDESRTARDHSERVVVPDYVPAHPDRYPTDGLALRLAARDLPRDPASDARKDDWRKHAWNLDYAWLTRDEARALVPEPAVPGAMRAAPRKVIERLARFHLRDFVRGEPSVWPAEALRHGELVSEVTGVQGDVVRLALRGRITLRYAMHWVRPEDGEERCSDCGFDAELRGEATWSTTQQAFTSFDLVAAGPRHGTNQYNNRADDLGPAPMGIAFTLAGHEPRDRTPPHLIYHRDYWGT
jgi:hypothetical protein